ncbi:hypothetical protein BD777DRAFT_127338 [Yarrowia lipolytica]|nr:hypothetical protein BD777DRAFT_127338 [Yarrowia lipolytica]
MEGQAQQFRGYSRTCFNCECFDFVVTMSRPTSCCRVISPGDYVTCVFFQLY